MYLAGTCGGGGGGHISHVTFGRNSIDGSGKLVCDSRAVLRWFDIMHCRSFPFNQSNDSGKSNDRVHKMQKKKVHFSLTLFFSFGFSSRIIPKLGIWSFHLLCTFEQSGESVAFSVHICTVLYVRTFSYE